MAIATVSYVKNGAHRRVVITLMQPIAELLDGHGTLLKLQGVRQTKAGLYSLVFDVKG